jgi:hypothetical protein
VTWRDSDGGAADGAVVAEAVPCAPRKGALLPAGPADQVAAALAASLPAARGLLAEGATVAVGAVERAVEALANPLQVVEGGSSSALYWVGASAWVVAAALACEGARRSWRRQFPLATSPAVGPDLPPEGEA